MYCLVFSAVCFGGLQTDENNVYLTPNQLDEKVATLQLVYTCVPTHLIWLGTVFSDM